jgi:predicted nucleic acid-binding protein
MANNLYVPDANVFLEYIYDRPLKNRSKQILQDAILNKIQIVVPPMIENILRK